MKIQLFITLIAGLGLFSCLTTPPPAPVTKPSPQAEAPAPAEDQSTIKSDVLGFSPDNSNPDAKMSFPLHFAYPSQVTGWTVTWLDPQGTPVKKQAGTGFTLPPFVTWDGRSTSDGPLTDGAYTAVLSVDYGKDHPAQTAKTSFVLDVTPPSATITISPNPFAAGGNSNLTIQLATKNGGGRVVSWRLGIVDSLNRQLYSFINQQHNDNVITWDGKDDKGANVLGNGTYTAKLQLLDEYGNHAEILQTFAVHLVSPAPVLQSSGPASPVKPAVFNVYFKPYSEDLDDDPGVAKANQDNLAAALSYLKAHPDLKISIIGHANKVNWNDAALGDAEQKYVLIPLSQKRAQAVVKLLSAQGIPGSSIQMSGVGDEDPLAAFGDGENNWKNRRAEIKNQ